ncbi:MAG: enoyl-CoA hydratase/isomerase family protein [Actinomycetota bacterium]
MPLVSVEVDHTGVATLTLRRPAARNALSMELCDAIVGGLEEIDGNGSARVVILAGEGKVFCSGADFAAVSGPDALDFLPAFERMLEAVAHFRLPVIARIQGAALGGGLQLASVCDFRVIDEDANVGIPSSRLGIVINFENVQRLVVLVGAARAKEVLLTARTFSGAEAVIAGLATSAHPADGLAAAAAELAERIAALAPLSVQGAKRAIDAVQSHLGGVRASSPERAEEIDRLVVEAYNSADLAEGLRRDAGETNAGIQRHLIFSS